MQKRAYLCIVKIKVTTPDVTNKTIILTIKKYTTMYAIAFFATVILFSASLYVGHKFVDIATHFDDSDAVKELHINHAAHIGAYRQSA